MTRETRDTYTSSRTDIRSSRCGPICNENALSDVYVITAVSEEIPRPGDGRADARSSDSNYFPAGKPSLKYEISISYRTVHFSSQHKTLCRNIVGNYFYLSSLFVW